MRLCKSNIDVDLSDSENVFDDWTNESNIDYTYPSSCAEAHEEPEKERPVSQKKIQIHSWWMRENGITTYKKFQQSTCFNNRLVSKINEAPTREDQIDCFFKITSYLQTPEGAYTTPSNANNSFSDTKSLNDFILFFR